MPKGRVLVVDDEPDVAQSWCDLLRLKDYVCETAHSAKEALQRFSKDFFEVAIVDYWLPDKKGIELAKELKSIKPFTRVILISGMIDTSKYPPKDLEGDASALALCDRYLTKPVDAATMLGVLDELLQDLQSKQGDWKARAKAATQEKSIDLKSVQELNKKIENHVRKPPQQDA